MNDTMQQPGVPCLFNDLKVALASLYSLPTRTNLLSQTQAHEFLMKLQSRNLRRKLHTKPEASSEGGSTWLACLAVLSHPNSHITERLFAAQTLNHRLRRLKLVEAVDIELETSLTISERGRVDVNVPQMVQGYRHWVQQFHPLLGAVLVNYEQEGEHIAKSEMTMLTLAALIVATTTTSNLHDQPLLMTLASALAVTALRLRYSPNQQDSDDFESEATPSMVDMVLHALSATIAAGRLEPSGAMDYCLNVCLAAIPDAVLSPGGAARERLSIDPRCLQAATRELRTRGVQQMWVSLRQMRHQDHVLLTCERWASFLPLPLEFVRQTIPLVGQCLENDASSLDQKRASLAYLIALYESGAWTADQVLSMTLGLSSSEEPKKRKSSRSKRRHKRFVDSHTPDDGLVQALQEVHHRGETACEATLIAWKGLQKVFKSAIATASSQIEGEGPIGCLAACANACLPHLVRNPSAKSQTLFAAIAESFRELCASTNRKVRALSYEPLLTLHAALVEHIRAHGPIEHEFEAVVIDHFYQCSMSLAVSCSYPADYFHNLAAPSDEDLEIERNDVRDVLRTVAGSDDTGSTSCVDGTKAPLAMTVKVLSKLLQACSDSIFSTAADELFPETAVHALSALAKPLNHLGQSYSLSNQPNPDVLSVLRVVLMVLSEVGQRLIAALPTAPVSDILPLSRVADLAIASTAPMISSLVMNRNTASDQGLIDELLRAINVSARSAALSIAHIPELTASSLLNHSQYDIRGAMRGPGGEDHVGCLAIMRLAIESTALAKAVVSADETFVMQLCSLHDHLKRVENERGIGIVHGHGVTHRSRRILLETICRIETTTEGQAGASHSLRELFNAALSTIASASGSSTNFDAQAMLQVTEATFDLASFSPQIVASLFVPENHQSDSIETKCIHGLVNACVHGYQLNKSPGTTDVNAIAQWNRLRAAIFMLLGTAITTDFPSLAVEAVVAWNQSECEAAAVQCSAGPSSHSEIFREDVVSDESVPAGLFIRAVCNVLEGKSDLGGPLPNCKRILFESRTSVLQAITSPCPEPDHHSFSDPRPTICEAWLQALNALIRKDLADDPPTKQVLVESCAAIVVLLFYPSLGKKRSNRKDAPGMTLDGPHGLALTEFLGNVLSMGPAMLHLVAMELVNRIPIDREGLHKWGDDVASLGISIFGAALFRASQGSLPPWAVESTPTIYAAFFVALDRDPSSFERMLRMSMEVRLSTNTESGGGANFGDVKPGRLLSGRYFENMNETAKERFITSAVTICRKDNHHSWKRLKVSIKQVCGGKKKDSQYNQRPSPTKWEFERV